MLQKTLQSFMKSDPDQDFSNFDGDLTGGLRNEDQTGGFWNPDMTGGFWNPDMTGGFFKERVKDDYMDCKEGGMNCRESPSLALLAKSRGRR